MAIFLVFLTACVAFLVYPIVGTIKNYHKARKIGLPIIFTPVSFFSLVWTFAGSKLGPLFERLPFRLGEFVRYTGIGASFANRYEFHDRLGPVFTIVSPSEIQIVVADAAAANEILARPKEFVKDQRIYSPLNILGPNVDTVNGETWQRHRRITTPPFNERNSSMVWNESLKQARDMLQSWTSKNKDGTRTTKSDIATLALHVLTAAGFGKAYAFNGGLTKLTQNHTLSYKDALEMIMDNVFTTILLGILPIPSIIFPASVKKVMNAVSEFREYLVEMVDEEKIIPRQDAEKDNLMSVLVRAAVSEERGTGRNGLSNEEIYGNLFIYSLAGHDTTANTLAYAVHIMATDSELQAWVREELISVLGDNEMIEDWEYEKAFPKLKRTLAFMYETLRLYGPITTIPKTTASSSQTITIASRPYLLPPETLVFINNIGLHCSPTYWGPDPLAFRPARWIVSGQEELHQPPPGAFVPWTSGPRVCPGKKFAQVEFVAVMARLLRKNAVRIVLEEAETEEKARERVWEVLEDSCLRVTIQIRCPEKVRLAWDEVS